jgi:cyclic beta-1,2-glucan glucanotransferase
VRVQGDRLKLAPCMPEHWPRAEISYRHRTARYEIAIENPQHLSSGIASIEVDGVRLADGVDSIKLIDDGAVHRVQVLLGARSSTAQQVRQSG